MPIGADTDRQGMSRADRNQLEADLASGESVELMPNWAGLHRFFTNAPGPDAGTPEREKWDASTAEVHRFMHTNKYTKQAADPDHEQHFPGHEQWKKDNPLPPDDPFRL